MRIIAGEQRGFVLVAPKGEATRPTLSRVRESVFSILGAQIIDAQVVDLFAGSGMLGLEALSRGAAQCTFVENGRHALDALSANVAKLGYERSGVIVRQNAIGWAASHVFTEHPQMIFADPPYHQDLAQRTLHSLGQNPSLAAGSTLILQHGKRDALDCTSGGGFTHSRTEKYGETIVQFFTLNC
jgi:16S rRNA (guanine966-N2)-methyltransferase